MEEKWESNLVFQENSETTKEEIEAEEVEEEEEVEVIEVEEGVEEETLTQMEMDIVIEEVLTPNFKEK